MCVWALSVNAYSFKSASGCVHEVTVSSPAASKRNVIVVLKSVSTNSDVAMCGLPTNIGSGYLIKSDSPDTFSAFLSVLLTAKSTKGVVDVLTSVGTEGCKIERVSLR